MKRTVYLITAALFGFFCTACTQEDDWKPLFNGENLENFDTYLGPPFPRLEELAAHVTPENVYSVVELAGEKVIRVSGEVHGSMATRESFSNYHLQMVFKWGEYVPHERNSGLLYHSYDPFGASYWTWMGSMEFQLMHGNLGDAYIMVDEIQCEASVENRNNQYIYAPGGEKVQFGQQHRRRMIRKALDNENPLGEWNTVDLYCFGTTAVHVVNGKTVLVNENISVSKDGESTPLTSGKIQIQSEGAEFFIKTMKIKPIVAIPAGLLEIDNE
ncbi:DUF1080 domain-containing protein [Bacteroides sp. 51]|uniref:3-keto-disaccharide hydrolase n=1 Tax=Bacteroides sp. 51 TaxID=2302938 RepID=UPI0013D7FFFC|nr:DUF1080 domain-containing protein [Bacteroides sp. 51]NDV81570.1 DUF1080 domain-containing protein [Bacteroides sp. 51]